MSAKHPPDRVFLVHGTFAENASWIQDGAKFSSALRDRLGVETIAFSWSGRNSHRARNKAALELAEVIKADAQLHPDAARSIVAHSHGGNVAIRALRQLGRDVPIELLVCLGTPFLVCGASHSRLLGDTVLWALRLVLFVILIGPTLYFGLYIFVTHVVPGSFGIEGVLFSSLFLCALYLSFKLPRLAGQYIKRRIAEKHVKIGTELEWPETPQTRLLNYQTARDEARLIVGFFQRISEIPLKLWGKGAQFINQHYTKLIVLTFISIGIVANTVGEDSILLVVVAFPFSLLVIFITLWVPFALFALIAPLFRSHPAGFGWEGLTQHFVYDVSITRDPEPYWTGSLQNKTLENETRFWAIKHSAFYDSDVVIGVLSYFPGFVLKSVLDSRNRASSCFRPHLRRFGGRSWIYRNIDVSVGHFALDKIVWGLNRLFSY